MATYGKNIDEAIEEAKLIYHERFSGQNEFKHNYESEQVSLFLPPGFKVKEETEYNIIIENSGQVYLLFFNPLEQKNSKIHYELDASLADESLLFETYETDDLFSYFFVLEEKKELNVVIAIGGAKISTKTSSTSLADSVGHMLTIVQSLSYR